MASSSIQDEDDTQNVHGLQVESGLQLNQLCYFYLDVKHFHQNLLKCFRLLWHISLKAIMFNLCFSVNVVKLALSWPIVWQTWSSQYMGINEKNVTTILLYLTANKFWQNQRMQKKLSPYFGQETLGNGGQFLLSAW